jgi:hypothetical protein
MYKTIFVCFFILLTLNSCKKDRGVGSDENDQLTLLTNKPWKATLVDGNPASNPSGKIMYFPALQCQLDDRLSFNRNNQLSYNVGQVSCENEDGNQTLDYKVDFNAKTITIDNKVLKIAELSSTRLKLYSVLPDVTGYSALVYLYVH